MLAIRISQTTILTFNQISSTVNQLSRLWPKCQASTPLDMIP